MEIFSLVFFFYNRNLIVILKLILIQENYDQRAELSKDYEKGTK